MFNKRIKDYFEVKNMSNRDLALKLNVDEGLLSRWLNGEKISNSFLYRLVEHFPDVDLNYLIKEPKPIEYVLDEHSLNLSEEMLEESLSNNELIKFHLDKIENHMNEIKKLMSQN